MKNWKIISTNLLYLFLQNILNTPSENSQNEKKMLKKYVWRYFATELTAKFNDIFKEKLFQDFE